MDKKNITRIKNDFPILKKKINGQRLAYLDSAASSQMPNYVMDEVTDFYHNSYANVHRGVDTLGYEATKKYEEARAKVADFINAEDNSEVVFTSGCTDSLNLIAATWGEEHIQAGDEIVVTIMDHHSNLIPWQQLAKRKHAVLKYIDLTDDWELDLENAQKQITRKTKIVALAHVSNVLGNVNPVRKIAQLAHKVGAVVVVDGAQAVGHFKVDVQVLDADFYTFSGHKMFAPDGIGVLYGRKSILEKMPPYRFGGEMISNVTKEDATWAEIPHKFEAGTPNIAGAVGLGSAIDYLHEIGVGNIHEHEVFLTNKLIAELNKLDYVTTYGPTRDRSCIVAFNLNGLHPHDVATLLDQQGVEARAGHHCAQPLMERMNVTATVRASMAVYNNEDDIDQLISAIKKAKEFFDGIK